MVDERTDANLRVFNTAKVFAEHILFPLMFDYKKFQRQSNFGSETLIEAVGLDQELREIQRFNGLKGMIETCHDLLEAIASTVRLKGNKKENEKLNELIITTDKIRKIFYEKKSNFFTSSFKGLEPVEVLNREYFEKVREIINACYINTEILMTRNKLLFADSSDEYATDKELQEQIKNEYVNN